MKEAPSSETDGGQSDPLSGDAPPAIEVEPGQAAARQPRRLPVPERIEAWIGRTALWSVTLFLTCGALLLPTATLWLLLPDPEDVAPAMRVLIWLFLISGALLFVVLFVLHRWLVKDRETFNQQLGERKLHVSLTAFNDEACIAQAVTEFKREDRIARLIVVDNNSRDATRERATEAGADRVVVEDTPGYGACCMRALAEAAKDLKDEDAIILCEGDMTFVARDIHKLLSYLENADVVVGTRATQELRAPGTQMDWLINPCNQIVAKLIQTRFWGTRLTDVGCTYRAIRVDAYRHLAPRLRVQGNHFSPHMIIEALRLRLRVLEVPIVFRRRGGISKGVGSNKIKAARVAIRMLALLYRS